jgi:tRNA threonylcarbamoyladenosine biosynthesis protein TsaB
MVILAVDTALGACSAALVDGETVLAHRCVPMARGHAEALAPMVAEVMAEAGLAFPALDRLAVTTGPGTFTGQRIGLAFMRALKVALHQPLTGITSLAAMGAAARDESHQPTAAVVHDARRGEVYLEIVGAAVRPVSIETFENAVEIIKSLPGDLALAGTGAGAVAAAIPRPGLQVTAIVSPDAMWVARLAAQQPVSAETPRPLYLRPPDAKLPAQP